MSVKIKTQQGATCYEPLQVEAQHGGGPLIGRYFDNDPISCLIWPAGATQESSLAVTPTGVWIDATLGTWSYNLTAAQTLAIPEGRYRTSATVAHAGNVEPIIETDLWVDGVGAVLGPPAASPVAGPSASILNLVPTLYCTDENIATRCLPDYTSLQPDSQMMAWGSDGYFLPADPWTLVSPSNNFAAQLPAVWSQQGAAYLSQVGYVVYLRKPQSAFPAGGILMGVAACSGNALTLRRLGMASGWGVAPAPAAGLTGVEFQISTFYPQIERVCYDLNVQYTIDATIQGRAPLNLSDMTPLRSTAVAMVLLDRYSDESRAGTGDYSFKVDMFKNELSDLRAKLQLRWGTGLESSPITNRFSTRLVR